MSQTIEQLPNSATPPALPDAKPSPKHPKRHLLLIALGVVIAATGISTWYFLSRPQINDLQLSGRIEGYETDIGAKIPGRVNFVAVREGEQVRRGQVVVKLDDNEIQAQLKGAQARLSAAQQQEQQARLQIQVVESQIQQAQLTLEQSQGDQQGRIFQAKSTVAATLRFRLNG